MGRGASRSGRISLVVTNDYEVMGDGSGDIRELMIRPTAEILDICEEFGVPHTLFVDMVEFWRFEEAERTGSLGADFRGASVIQEQLRSAVSRGHDVQLHLHPQWLDAVPHAPGSWSVDRAHWRLPDVPGGIGDRGDVRSLRGLFHRGTNDLEEMLRTVSPGYRCIAFRAGGYCVQPAEDVLRVMREEGLRIDSSVAVGRKKDDRSAWFDFRDAPDDRSHWFIEDSVTVPAAEGLLLEVPIFTDPLSGSWLRRLWDFPPPSPDGVVSRTGERLEGLGLEKFARGLFGTRANLDFCKLTGTELIRLVERGRERYTDELASGSDVPLVMTSHSKEWSDGSALRVFLEWASSKNWLRFTTFPGWLAEHHPALIDGGRRGAGPSGENPPLSSSERPPDD